MLQVADPAKNFKSIRTSIFIDKYQALLKSGIIKRDGGEIKFSSTVYGLFKLFDSTIAIDTNYRRYGWARSLSLGAGLQMGDDNRINGFSPAFTWAIVNGRELNVRRYKKEWNNIIHYVQETEPFLDLLLKRREEIENSPGLDAGMKVALMKIMDDFNDNQDISTLKGILDENMIAAVIKSQQALKKSYTQLENDLKSAPLLTFGFNGNYTEKSWNTLSFKAEFLKGAGFRKDKEKNWDIYSGAFLNLEKDTTLNKNLQRQSFSYKLGLNTVLLKTKDQKNSMLEILGALEYKHIMKGLYPEEKTNNLLADFTLSIRLGNDVYLPLEIKYDPQLGQFFGFLDLKVDIKKVLGN
jgi:hypothetical protein